MEVLMIGRVNDDNGLSPYSSKISLFQDRE